MQNCYARWRTIRGVTISVHSLVFKSDIMQETHQGSQTETQIDEEYSKPKKDRLFNQYNFITISKDVSVLRGAITLCDLSLIAKRHSRWHKNKTKQMLLTGVYHSQTID